MACWRSEFIRPVREEREGMGWGSGLLRGQGARSPACGSDRENLQYHC